MDSGVFQALVEHPVHHLGIGALRGFRHSVLGDDAVFFHEVDEHIPLLSLIHI